MHLSDTTNDAFYDWPISNLTITEGEEHIYELPKLFVNELQANIEALTNTVMIEIQFVYNGNNADLKIYG